MKGSTTANEVKKTRNNVFLDVLVFFSIFLVIGGFAYMILNPGKMKSDVRNSSRNTDILTIMQKMVGYVEETGNIPDMIPLNRACASIGNEICKTGTSDCKGYVDLTKVVGKSILPVDIFRNNKGNGTGYYVSHDGEGSIIICAPLAERSVKIELKQFMY